MKIKIELELDTVEDAEEIKEFVSMMKSLNKTRLQEAAEQDQANEDK